MKVDKEASKRLGVTVMVDENAKKSKPKVEPMVEPMVEETPKKKEKKAKDFLRDEE